MFAGLILRVVKLPNENSVKKRVRQGKEAAKKIHTKFGATSCQENTENIGRRDHCLVRRSTQAIGMT